MKPCGVCKEDKPLEAFHRQASSKDGRAWLCKPCSQIRRREWRSKRKDYDKEYHKRRYAANPEYYKEKALRWYRNNKLKHKCYKFNISPSTYQKLAEGQEGKCALCLKERPLVIDHDHLTKKVRGLLCNTCNLSLGMFEDSIPILRKAIKYLK